MFKTPAFLKQKGGGLKRSQTELKMLSLSGNLFFQLHWAPQETSQGSKAPANQDKITNTV